MILLIAGLVIMAVAMIGALINVARGVSGFTRDPFGDSFDTTFRRQFIYAAFAVAGFFLTVAGILILVL